MMQVEHPNSPDDYVAIKPMPSVCCGFDCAIAGCRWKFKRSADRSFVVDFFCATRS